MADRTIRSVHFAPTERDDVPSHVLVTGPVREVSDHKQNTYATVALYQVAMDATSDTAQGLGGAKVLAEHCFVPSGDDLPSPGEFTVKTDMLGRLLVEDFDPLGENFTVDRIDLISGVARKLGSIERNQYLPNIPLFTLSPTRARVLLGGTLSPFDVVELDDRHTLIGGGVSNASFVGSYLYYTHAGVFRVASDGQPELLASDGDFVFAFTSDLGPRVVVRRWIDAQDGTTDFLLDPKTLQKIPLPIPLAYDPQYPYLPQLRPVSPNGQWLVLGNVSYGGSHSGKEEKFAFFNWVRSRQEIIITTSKGDIC